jgi:hypothetical protein
VHWINTFYSDRTATILINGITSEQYKLLQANIPQGLSFLPMLFLFFNTDLVQHKLDQNRGTMAFVDDNIACVTGSSAEANRVGIQLIIDRAVDCEKRCGATFEGEKTALIFFTRNTT